MAISNFTTLRAAVESHLDRSDLSATVPMFIELAEWRLARILRVAPLIESASVVVAAGGASAALPADFMEAVNVKHADGSEVFYTPPDRIDQITGEGTPWLYTMTGATMTVAPAWTVGGTLTLTYWAKQDALSDESTASWYITHAPDAMLYGALVAAEPFLKNDPRLAMWKSLFDEALASINAQYGALDPEKRRKAGAVSGGNTASDMRNAA